MMPPIFQRLRERKLGQWMLAYSAGAFFVYTALDPAREIWGIPNTVIRAIHVLLVIGFFITLVLAWYHGEKGRQRVSGPELVIVAAMLVVAGAAISLVRAREDGVRPGHPELTAGAPDGRPSIAVLPCDNISPDPDDAYLADGIHEEILVRLQKISSLRSISRSSVLQYRQSRPAVNEIALALGAGFIGECSVRKDPDREQIRLTFQLLDTNGTQIRGETYDRDLTAENLFEMESNVASQIASAVRAEIIPDERARIQHVPTQNLSAYEAYLLGRHYVDRREDLSESLAEAVRWFEVALEEDPEFALAHAALAEVYDLMASWGLAEAPRDIWPLVAEEARQALAIDSTLAEAHTMLADWVLITSWDWEAAERGYQRAIQLRPGYDTAHLWYSVMLSAQGRGEESLAQGRIGSGLNPGAPSWVVGEAIRFFNARSFAEAIAEVEDALARGDPNNAMAMVWLCWAYLFNDDPERAGETIERAAAAGADSATVLGMTAMVHAKTGERQEALRVIGLLRGLSASGARYVDPFNIWPVLAALGEHDEALDWLEKGIEDQSYFTIYSLVSPLADPLRADPRYGVVLDRIRLGHLRRRFDSLASRQGTE